MNIWKGMLLSLGFAALISLAHVSESAEFSNEHLAEAERLVYALGIAESLSIPATRALQRLREKDPARADLLDSIMKPYLDKKFLGREIRGFIAGEFDIETCRQLAELWEGPVGRKFVNTQVQLLSTGAAPQLEFTADEEAIMKRFEQTPAAQAFARGMPVVMAKIADFAKDTKEKIDRKHDEELARRREGPSRK
jgi:hypothetical protein